MALLRLGPPGQFSFAEWETSAQCLGLSQVIAPDIILGMQGTTMD